MIHRTHDNYLQTSSVIKSEDVSLLKITVKKRVGVIVILIIHVFLLFLLIGYSGIACSTMRNNICHVPYEPSGGQILFYYFNLPIFIVISVINYFLNTRLKNKIAFAITPLIIWFSFYLFIEYIDKFVHFPFGNELFYHGSLYIAVVSFFLLILSAYWQIKVMFKFCD